MYPLSPTFHPPTPHYTTPTPRIPDFRDFWLEPLKFERDFCIGYPHFRWTPLPEAIPSRRISPIFLTRNCQFLSPPRISPVNSTTPTTNNTYPHAVLSRAPRSSYVRTNTTAHITNTHLSVPNIASNPHNTAPVCLIYHKAPHIYLPTKPINQGHLKTMISPTPRVKYNIYSEYIWCSTYPIEPNNPRIKSISKSPNFRSQKMAAPTHVFSHPKPVSGAQSRKSQSILHQPRKSQN